MSKKCMPLWREARFQVKMYKAHHSRTTFGSWDVEKVHAVVVRSTFPSENAQNIPFSGHFWKLRCRKSARRCGAKHFSKSKCWKHQILGPLLDVQMTFRVAGARDKSKQNVRVLSHFQKRWQACDILRGSARRAAGAVQETCWSEMLGGQGPDFLREVAFWSIIQHDRCSNVQHFVWPFSWQAQDLRDMDWKNHKTHWYEAVGSALNFPLLKEVSKNCFAVSTQTTTLHYTALHYTALYCTTLRYFNYTTLLYNYNYNYTTLHYNYTTLTTTTHQRQLHIKYNYNYATTTLHYTTLHYATLRYATLRYATLRYTTLHYTTYNYIQLQLHTNYNYHYNYYYNYSTVHTLTNSYNYNYATLHCAALHPLHYTRLHSTPLHPARLHYNYNCNYNNYSNNSYNNNNNNNCNCNCNCNYNKYTTTLRYNTLTTPTTSTTRLHYTILH